VAVRDKSFTVNIIPHDANRSRREWRVTGKRLLLFRVVLILSAIAVAGAVIILTIGAEELSRSADLRQRNQVLTDSLSVARELNRRLDGIEQELQEIRDTRQVIENLATAGVSGEEPE